MQNFPTTMRRHLTRALLLATASTCIGGAAMAQEDSDGLKTSTETVNGETVVVVRATRFVPKGALSANKTNIPLIETPQSVSVISRDQIDLLGFVDLQQAVRYTAGVFGENYGPDLRYDFITTRGFTPKQYVDGLATPVTTTIFSTGVDLYAFDTMTVLKGPAATLYGNTPPGGIYDQTSRRASRAFGGELQAKAGSYDYTSLAGTVTGALSDTVSARVTGLILDRGAERRFVDAKRTLFAPTLTWNITEADTLNLLAYVQDDKVNGDTNGFLPVVGTLEPNPLGQVSQRANLGEPDYNVYKRNQWALGYNYTHKFSNTLAFVSNAKYSKYRESSKVIYGAGLGADNRTVSRYSFPYMENVESFAIDNRLDATFTAGSVTHKVLVGLDYRDVKNFAQYGFAMASSIDLFNPVYSTNPGAIVTPPWLPYSDQVLKQTGLYVQDQIGIDKLLITLGGRYDEDTIKSPSSKTEDSKFTYKVGATYVFDSGVAPYASFATSFEPVIGTGFVPTEGEQAELGVKYDGRTLGDDIRLFATAAVYQIKQTNVVSTVYSPAFLSTQIGEVEVKGFEAEFVARFNEQLSINGSYTYTDSEVVASNNPAEIGGPMPTTPKNKVSLFADYTLSTGTFAGLGFGAGVRYSSKGAGAFGGGIYGESSTLYDVALHYDTVDWRMALNGSNVTDEVYVARCSGPVGCTYGAGQTWTATLTRKF